MTVSHNNGTEYRWQHNCIFPQSALTSISLSEYTNDLICHSQFNIVYDLKKIMLPL